MRGRRGHAMTLDEAIRDYTERGFSLVPFRAIPPEAGSTKWRKKPLVKWESRMKQAADPATVLAEFKKYPDALIGCCTGGVSRICSLDVDDEEGRERVDELVPDSLLVPTYRTISGGQQMIFEAPTPCPPGAVRFLRGLDFRGESSCTILPPSDLGYQWLDGLSLAEVAPPGMPNALLSAILNNSTLYRGRNTSADPAGGMFADGRRDNDLFHIANVLTKGGMPAEEIAQVLERLIISWGERPDPKWISEKIESAKKRNEKREISYSQEVNDFVVTSSGFFSTSDVFNRLQVTSRQEKKNVVVALLRLHKDGVIERHGQKDGVYRRVETEVEEVNFLTAPTDEFAIRWPMEIEELCTIYPGNIIVIAGGKDAGKTAFLLNTVRMNQKQHEIVYLNSEMGDTEFRKRLEKFPDAPLDSWSLRAIHRSSNFADLITPERKIFIVDFLELTTDFWKVAGMIQEIHSKLKEGICIIALQKADGKDIGRGGDFSREKSRLYLSLSHDADRGVNTIKIVNAKAWRTDRNPRGMHRDFKLIQGWRFAPQSYWRD